MKVFGVTAPSTGSGKTTVTMAFLSALPDSAAVKIGPDYIDTGLESMVSGHPAHNMDRWIEGKGYLRMLDDLAQDYQYAVVEGVMGLYDSGSSIDLSTDYYFRKFRIPYILVVDCSKTAESTYYISMGFLGKRCIGVILNNYGSQRHLEMVMSEFRRHGVRIIGSIPNRAEYRVESRNLGLHTSQEQVNLKERIRGVAGCIDLSFLDELEDYVPQARNKTNPPVNFTGRKISVALDRAFNFYYSSSLEYLHRLGKVEYFSPVKGEGPDHPDMIYLGGGYPELYAGELSRNQRFRESILESSQTGKIVIAECGGLMYLEKSIKTEDGTFQMAGVFNGTVEMDRRLTLSYTKLVARRDTVMFSKNQTVYGHEYHYSRVNDESDLALENFQGRGIDGKRDGLIFKNTQATYSHFSLARYGKKIERELPLV